MDESSEDPIASFETSASPSPLAAFVEKLRAQADDANNPSGIIHWSPFFPYALGEHDGVERRAVCDQPQWQQFHLELFGGRRTGVAIPSPGDVRDIIFRYAERGEVPIAIDHFAYETARRTFVGNLLSTVRKGVEPEMPASADRVVESRRAFFASALLPDRSDAFTPLPHVHTGLDVKFVVPRELYLTNVAGEPSRIEADFDDGLGWRAIRFGEPAAVSYEAVLPIHIRVRVEHGGIVLASTFRFAVRNPCLVPALIPVFDLKAAVSFRNRPLATGKAWLAYANGRQRIEKPIIFADGFGEGESNCPDIWDRLNRIVPFGDELRAAGWDVILLGYGSKSAFIQENSYVAADCIRKVIQARHGNAKLVVVGGSMGGLVTRHALREMETKGEKHETAIYISFDSPHNHAWLPLILQYMAHYYKNVSTTAARQSALVNSPAAQQMLWGHVPDWNYRGAITRNEEKEHLIREFRKLGFPQSPRKLGIANGVATGQANGVPGGAVNLDFDYASYSGQALTSPPPGLNQYLGKFWVRPDIHPTEYRISTVPQFDSAPGGTTNFFELAGEGVGVRARHPNTCFIPSVSALAMKFPYTDLFQNINAAPPGSSHFDEIKASSTATGHVDITRELADWIKEKIGKSPESPT